MKESVDLVDDLVHHLFQSGSQDSGQQFVIRPQQRDGTPVLHVLQVAFFQQQCQDCSPSALGQRHVIKVLSVDHNEVLTHFRPESPVELWQDSIYPRGHTPCMLGSSSGDSGRPTTERIKCPLILIQVRVVEVHSSLPGLTGFSQQLSCGRSQSE